MRLKTFFYLAALAATLWTAPAAQAQVGTGGLVFFGDRVVKESIASTAPIVQIAGGRFFSIALRADGSIASWGADNFGQCDIAPGLTNVQQVAAGQNHALILLADGTVRGLGFNNYGQINVPVGLTNVVQVACGQYTSYALKGDGTIVVWGWLAAGLTPPPGLTNVKQIAAGQAHVVALRYDGTVVCWGSNDHGELNFIQGANNVTAISVNYEHSVALRLDGTVTCWGNDDYLQSDVPPGLQAVAVAAGPTHTLALKANGTVVGWGSNASGESIAPANVKNIKAISAGEAASYAINSDGKAFAWGDGSYGQTNIPTAMYNVQKIAAGWGHVMLLKQDGSLGAWGRSNEGQCNLSGLPTSGYTDVTAGAIHTGASGSPFHISDVFGDNGFMQCAINGSNYDHYWAFGYNTFAHKVGGGVDAYGKNSEGQFGLAAMGDFIQITGGQFHALGLKANGTISAAGSDNYGQLDVPAGLANVQQISSGYATNLALLKSGSVVAWGMNDAGQQNVPLSLPKITQVAAGHEHSVALTALGGVIAWGDNFYGQTNVPDGLIGMAQIGAGEYFTVCLPRVSLSVAPYAVYGLTQATGTVYIPTPAGPNGVSIGMSSSSPVAGVPPVVVVPMGATMTTFQITTTNPDIPTQAVITATLGGLAENALLTVRPTAFTMTTSVPSVIGGSTQPITLNVTLTHPAPPGGASIAVVSSDPSVSVTSPIFIAAGSQTKQVSITDLRVHVATPVAITGTYSNTVAVDAVTVNPFKIVGFSVSPQPVLGGTSTNATVTLNAVPTSAVAVSIASTTNSVIAGPVSLTVPANGSTGTLNLVANPVSVNTPLTLTATLDGSYYLCPLTVDAALSKIALSAASAYGATYLNATITLQLPAPAGGLKVNISATNGQVSTTTWTIGANQTQGTFQVATNDVPVNSQLSVVASLGPQYVSAGAVIIPNRIATFTVTPTTFVGLSRSLVMATFSLNAPVVYDTYITPSSTNANLASLPALITIKAGSNTCTVPVIHHQANHSTNVTLTGTRAGVSKAVVVTVN